MSAFSRIIKIHRHDRKQIGVIKLFVRYAELLSKQPSACVVPRFSRFLCDPSGCLPDKHDARFCRCGVNGSETFSAQVSVHFIAVYFVVKKRKHKRITPIINSADFMFFGLCCSMRFRKLSCRRITIPYFCKINKYSQTCMSLFFKFLLPRKALYRISRVLNFPYLCSISRISSKDIKPSEL